MFIRANHKSASAVKSILDNYGKEVGQWLNLSKSTLTFSINTDHRLVAMVEEVMDIPAVSPSFQYLG